MCMARVWRVHRHLAWQLPLCWLRTHGPAALSLDRASTHLQRQLARDARARWMAAARLPPAASDAAARQKIYQQAVAAKAKGRGGAK